MSVFAIIGNGNDATFDWFLADKEGSIATHNRGRLTFQMLNGSTYYVICDELRAKGREFNGYIIAPTYQTLEDVVKARLR